MSTINPVGVVLRLITPDQQKLVQTNANDTYVIANLTATMQGIANLTSASAINFGESKLFHIPTPMSNFMAYPTMVVAVYDTTLVAAASSAYSVNTMVGTSFCGLGSTTATPVVLGVESDLAATYAVLGGLSPVGYMASSVSLNTRIETSLFSDDSRRYRHMTANRSSTFLQDGAGGFYVPFVHNQTTSVGTYIRVCSIHTFTYATSTIKLSSTGTISTAWNDDQRSRALTAYRQIRTGAIGRRRLLQHVRHLTQTTTTSAAESASYLLSAPPSPPPSPPTPPPSPPPSPPPTQLYTTGGLKPLAIYSMRNVSLPPLSFATAGVPIANVCMASTCVDVYQLSTGAPLTFANGTSLQVSWGTYGSAVELEWLR